jgi:hypothetical protein
VCPLLCLAGGEQPLAELSLIQLYPTFTVKTSMAAILLCPRLQDADKVGKNINS